MASTNSASASALFLSLNLLFFAFATATQSAFATATQSVPCPPPPSKAKPTPNPTAPTTPSSPAGTCPRDALKLGVCANVLGLVNAKVGSPPTLPCCSLIQGLVDLEAAVCLCTALKANVLGINLNIPLSLSLLLNVCGKRVPTEFQCA